MGSLTTENNCDMCSHFFFSLSILIKNFPHSIKHRVIPGFEDNCDLSPALEKLSHVLQSGSLETYGLTSYHEVRELNVVLPL